MPEQPTRPPLSPGLQAFLRWATAPLPFACPQCGHVPVTIMVYGLHRRIYPALQAALDAGRKQLAGCLRGPRSPIWYCRGCGHAALPPTPEEEPPHAGV
jgi:rubredoxin